MLDNTEEAFPKSEKLLSSAYAISDPTSERLKLIKAHPTEPTVTELLIFYIEENPSRENALASALVDLHDSLDARIIQSGSSLPQVFDDGLNDLHSDRFDFDYRNLSSSPVQYSYIEDGLNAFDDSAICELLIGVCIKLFTNGSYIILMAAKPFIRCANEVALKLKF